MDLRNQLSNGFVEGYQRNGPGGDDLLVIQGEEVKTVSTRWLQSPSCFSLLALSKGHRSIFTEHYDVTLKFTLDRLVIKCHHFTVNPIGLYC